MRTSDYIEQTVLGKKLTSDASILDLTLRILRIATDDCHQINALSEIGWQDLKLREIARLIRIVRRKLSK